MGSRASGIACVWRTECPLKSGRGSGGVAPNDRITSVVGGFMTSVHATVMTTAVGRPNRAPEISVRRSQEADVGIVVELMEPGT